MKQFILKLVILLVIVSVGFFIYAWKPAIAVIEPPQRADFDESLIEKGARLAAVGNCTACHTNPGGQSFAGSFSIPTPFGTIYSSNITPDAKTGIGQWSEEAFIRAMREGVGRDGSHLYPAFPFDHFTKVSDEDNKALYAFLMTRPAVEQATPENDLPFPLNIRVVLAGWKMFFFDQGAYQAVASESEEWNRGAYLVDGLGHCGACHTPRNALGAEKGDGYLAGGEAEGWSAYALNAASPAPVPWTADSLYTYLRQGWDPDHGVANGPMAEVTGNLGLLPDSDIRAMSVYLESLMGPPSSERQQQGEEALEAAAAPPDLVQVAASEQQDDKPASRGKAIYTATCATCHAGNRQQPFGGSDPHLLTALNAPDPQNAINVILFGLPAASGRQSPIMPGFAATMNDQQVSDLLAYLREEFTRQPAWSDIANRLADTRSGKYHVSVLPSDGIERGPDNVGARDQ